MHYTVEALLQGKEKVLEYFEKAKDKWKELFGKEGDADEETWSEWIVAQSPYFEEECGGRLMAPEIMAYSAFGLLYSIQFGWRDAERAKARKFVKAIGSGAASAELKKCVEKAADFYDLDKASASPEAA